MSRLYPADIAIGHLATIHMFNGDWWFIGYYFFVVLIGYVFLNNYLQRQSQSQYTSLLIVLFAVLSLSWTGSLVKGISSGLRTLLAGIFCYMWGGYCRRYNPLARIKPILIMAIIIALFCLAWLSYYNATMNSIKEYLNSAQSQMFIQLTRESSFTDYKIVSIGLAVLIFELFRRIKMKNSRIINTLSASCLMVYMIHDNGFVRNYWRFTVDYPTILNDSPLRFCLEIFKSATVIFLMGIVVYFFYTLIAAVFKGLHPEKAYR